MKRITTVIALSIAFMAQSLYGVQSTALADEEISVLNIHLSELEQTVRGLSDEKTYELVLADDFIPSDVTPAMIQALHEYFETNTANTLTGPIEYIFFSGLQSPRSFYELKKHIENSKDKYVCIDIGDSSYAVNASTYATLPLPENCFAGHENIYWAYFGNFIREDVPENVCRNCPNLRIVFMWGEGVLNSGAFENVSPDAVIAGVYGESKKLSDYIRSKGYAKRNTWDYEAFDSDYDYTDVEKNLYSSEVYASGRTFRDSDLETVFGNYSDYYSDNQEYAGEAEPDSYYDENEVVRSLNDLLQFYGEE
ncbi:hypothetical protein [Treponema sp.]|uniref:hypothetical protein n=1 Tax=Treponema sp. TaxID=166 RepID=UPI00257E3983|nr:hypothetical protein [Treponema sp.]MBE6355381.1 hypothetical protein [Treponema sp.]